MKTKLKYLIASVIVIATIVACTVPQVVTNPDGSTSTNAAPDPRLLTGIEAARAANAASAPFNPLAYLLEIGLTAATAGAVWVAKRKNDKSAANELLLKTVIQAIDSLDDSKVKQAISDHAVRVGVEGDLNTAVQKVGSGLI